jgi:arylsulfatase A-like enzyme
LIGLSSLELALRQRLGLLIPVTGDFVSALGLLLPWLSLAAIFSSAVIAILLRARGQQRPQLLALCAVVFLDATVRLVLAEAWLGAADETKSSASFPAGMIWVLLLPTLLSWVLLVCVGALGSRVLGRMVLGSVVLALCAGGLALLPPGSDVSQALDQERRSNLLLVTIDTWRYDHLSMHPAAVSSTLTPHLDQLGRSSVMFSEARSHAPLTVPSHASLLSGLRPWELGMLSNSAKVPSGARWLPELLSAEGYSTGAVVSGAVLRGSAGFARGFDSFHEDLNEHAGLEELIVVRLLKLLGLRNRSPVFRASAPRAVERSKAFIHRSEGPWFLWMHLFDPHTPYPAITQGGDTLGELPDPCLFPQEVRREAPFADLLPAGSQPEESTSCAERGALASQIRGYQRQVQLADQAVGDLLDWLSARGEHEDTAIIVTADHGESLTEHGLWISHQFSPYEPVLRVPLLVRPAGGTAGRVSDLLVEHRDMPATAVQLLGLHAAVQGRSWLDLAATESPRATNSIRARVASTAQARPEFKHPQEDKPRTLPAKTPRLRVAVRDRAHSVIVGPGARLERYDLLDDPSQQHDLGSPEAESPARPLLEEALAIYRQWAVGPGSLRDAETPQ